MFQCNRSGLLKILKAKSSSAVDYDRKELTDCAVQCAREMQMDTNCVYIFDDEQILSAVIHWTQTDHRTSILAPIARIAHMHKKTQLSSHQGKNTETNPYKRDQCFYFTFLLPHVKIPKR